MKDIGAVIVQLKKDQAAATKNFTTQTAALLKNLTADAKAATSQDEFKASGAQDTFTTTLQQNLDDAKTASDTQ